MVAHQLQDVGQPGVGVASAVALDRERREQVPLRGSGAGRVGGDDLHPGAEQVVPVADARGVALAHHEGDDRSEGSAVVGVALLPVLVDEAFPDQPGDVRLDREVDHVRGNVPGDLARLVPRSPVRLGETDLGALCRSPEGRDDVVEPDLGDNPTYVKLAALYHDPEVEAAARQDLGGDGVFKTNDAADLQATTAELEKVIRGAGA